MSEQIILINKFYRDFCFCNQLIACHWFDVKSFHAIEEKLNGEVELTKHEVKTIESLLLHKRSENEVKALELIIFNLINDLTIYKK